MKVTGTLLGSQTQSLKDKSEQNRKGQKVKQRTAT